MCTFPQIEQLTDFIENTSIGLKSFLVCIANWKIAEFKKQSQWQKVKERETAT